MPRKLQGADFKTEAELTGAGGTASQLLNDTQVWVTANTINKTLDDAITDGDIGGGGADDPTAMSNIVATRLGYKQYLHGTTYNGGIAPTTSATAYTIARARYVPYQMQDGSWRMTFNITGTRASGASITSLTVTINGIVFKNVSNDNQAITMAAGNLTNDRDVGYAIAAPNTSTFFGAFASNNILTFHASGDVELNAAPTWAYV